MGTYLILGANGQLGKQFGKELAAHGENVIAPDEKDCDITNSDTLARYVEMVSPTVIINCAAYNAVELAEQQSDIVNLINGKAVENIATLCGRHGIFFIHYSSDYVFDGKKGELYTERDAPNPLNVYGRSKLAGEEAVQKHASDFLLFRTSWVFGDGTQNFIHKFLQWSRKSYVLKLSSDEVSVPTSSADLVSLTMASLEKGLRGLYHLTNSDYASRYEWGRYVAKVLSLDNLIIPVPMSTFPSTVQRPTFTAMSNAQLQHHLGLPIRDWRSAVDRFFEEYPPNLIFNPAGVSPR
jgi:dTDP-4-dehydrorhamnose reductase